MHLPQKIIKSELYRQNINDTPEPQVELPVKTNETDLLNEDIGKNTNIAKKDTDTEKINIKSSLKSNELYIGFEQIILPDISSDIIQQELQNSGITRSQNSFADLRQNYIVNDLTDETTYVTADKNGNISVYISADADNLFDISVTDTERNKDMGQFTVLANNENAYSLLGFEQGKSYSVKITSKTKNDWDINGNYIIY